MDIYTILEASPFIAIFIWIAYESFAKKNEMDEMEKKL